LILELVVTSTVCRSNNSRINKPAERERAIAAADGEQKLILEL
jgi:hypothetical protein